MDTSTFNENMDYNDWSPNYGNLPMEIIIHIFRYLHHSDLQAAGSACSRWREALFVSELNRNIQVRFSKVCLSDRLAPAKLFLKCQRPYRTFCLEDVTFGQAQELLEHIGKTAIEITFDNADMGDKQFYAFMRQLPHLESLTVTQCSPLFMSGSFLDGNGDFGGAFSKLRNLSLKHNQYLSDAILLRLTSLIEGIETLDMTGCHIAYHNAIHRRFYPNDSFTAHPSESILTFKFLTRVAKLHRSHLRELNLSHTMISGPALQSLTTAEEEVLNLHRLRLAGCRQLNTSGVKSFLQTQNNLVVLDLADTLCVNDDCMAAITQALPKLKDLNVAGCGAITNVGATMLGNLKYLKILNISRCDGITTDGLTQGIARTVNSVLMYLYMSHLIVCEESIKCIARNCPELRVLNVGHCVNGVTDASVQCIVENLRWLRDLSLEDCFRVTDAALTGINISKLEMKNSTQPSTGSLDNFHPTAPSSLHERESLRSSVSPQSMKISLRSKAEEDIVRDATRKRVLFAAYELNLVDDNTVVDGFSIQQLKGLRSLNLKGCNKITDVSLKYGLKFVELQRLFLSNCQQISLFGMETLVLNCPSIEELDLSDCYNINDNTIKLITTKFSRLRSLHISGCTQLTDHSLDAILVNCKCLQTLSIYRCRRMYTDIEDRLAVLPTLRHLNMDNAGSLDNVEIFRLKKRLDY